VAVRDRPARVPQVADRGDPARQLGGHRRGDHGVEFAVVEFGELVQGPGAAVPAQVHVGVDEPREQRGPGQFGDGDAGRGGGRRRLDADDATALDQDEQAAGQQPFAVERPGCPVPVHDDPLGPVGGWRRRR
jgi:hypothetical protein